MTRHGCAQILLIVTAARCQSACRLYLVLTFTFVTSLSH